MLNKTYFYGLLLCLIFNASSLSSECLPWCSAEWSTILREKNWPRQEEQIRKFGKIFGYVICCCNLYKLQDAHNNDSMHTIPYFNEKAYANICFDKKNNEIYIKLSSKDVLKGESEGALEFDTIEFAFHNEWVDIQEYLFKNIKISSFNMLCSYVKIYFSFVESFCKGYNGLLRSLMRKDDGVWNGLFEQIVKLKSELDSKASLTKEDNYQLIEKLWKNNGSPSSFKEAFKYIWEAKDTEGEV